MTTTAADGPWKMRKLKRTIHIFWPPTGKLIATVPLSPFLDNGGQERCAKIATAAPEMLAALVACHRKIAAAEAIADLRESEETKMAWAAIQKAWS